jgi:hypothetical protein
MPHKTMFAIYSQRLGDKAIKILDTAESLGEAKEKLDEQAKKFVVFEEGERRLSDVWQKEPVDPSKFSDGYYFIKTDDYIDVYRKASTKKEVTGWFGNVYPTTEYKTEAISYFGISKFTAEVLTQLCTYKAPIKKLNTNPEDQQKSTAFANLFEEMKKYGFKPQKTKVTLKKQDPETEKEKKFAVEVIVDEDEKPQPTIEIEKVQPAEKADESRGSFDGWTSELRGRKLGDY